MNIAKFPDVIKTEEKEDDEDKLWSMLKVALENALLKLKEMRSEEGKKLAEDIQNRCDLLKNYIEDIALIAEMGVKAYRFSIDWSRIFADGHTLNKIGLEFYDSVLDELEKYNIEPVVTISHFEIPYALVEEIGSWTDRRMIDAYMEFSKVLIDRYHSRVTNWMTFNEINIIVIYNKGHTFL